MLKHLKICNVGPAPIMELEFGKRLNLLTGDNGLGKSFLLDIAWWALTRKWPAELNKRLPTGLMAKPYERGEASITFSFTAKTRSEVKYQSYFDRKAQAWTGKAGRPSNSGLVLYAQVDGSFAVWDPARNYWRKKGSIDIQERPLAYVFSPRDVWNGLVDEERGLLCNGLISDWAGWQKGKSVEFESLCKVLDTLSPAQEIMLPGELTRIGLDDPRDIPTLKMPYGQSVPILHASAGVRRILAVAYLLVWSWKEHKTASITLDQETTSQVVFLIDEIEAHLHPRWQRCIVQALLEVVGTLIENADVQIIAATHSPLVMASAEPTFDPNQDTWFDLDLVRNSEKSDEPIAHPGSCISKTIRKSTMLSNHTSESSHLTNIRSDFAYSLMPVLNKPVYRLGIAGNYGITSDDVLWAADQGANYWLWGASYGKVTPGIRQLIQQDREHHIVAMLGMGIFGWQVRWSVERALRKLNTDYLDVFKLGWLGRMSRYSPGIVETLLKLKAEGKIKAIGISIHDRERAGLLARDSDIDIFMLRYNAKHPGAEQDIFPHLAVRNPGVVAYTALAWRQLIRPVRGIEMPPWPGDPQESVPPLTANLCYRFVLTNPHVHLVLTGPRNRQELAQNMEALHQGSLTDEEMAWIRLYGKELKSRRKLDYI